MLLGEQGRALQAQARAPAPILLSVRKRPREGGSNKIWHWIQIWARIGKGLGERPGDFKRRSERMSGKRSEMRLGAQGRARRPCPSCCLMHCVGISLKSKGLDARPGKGPGDSGSGSGKTSRRLKAGGSKQIWACIKIWAKQPQVAREEDEETQETVQEVRGRFLIGFTIWCGLAIRPGAAHRPSKS